VNAEAAWEENVFGVRYDSTYLKMSFSSQTETHDKWAEFLSMFISGGSSKWGKKWKWLLEFIH